MLFCKTTIQLSLTKWQKIKAKTVWKINWVFSPLESYYSLHCGFLISSFLTCPSKVGDSSSYHTSTVGSWAWTNYESLSAFTVSHVVAYRPAAYMRQFISDRNDKRTLLCVFRNVILVLTVKLMSLWRLF